MTARTVPARPGHDAGLRPVRWRRMAWVTWRQHRFALAGVAALLGALAVYLWLTGSSSTSNFGRRASARVSASCACWPPDSFPALRFSGMPSSASRVSA